MIRCVLHVDDDSDDRYVFKIALLEAMPDVKLISADSVDDMFAKINDCSQERPDIIFLDLNMREKTGFEGLLLLKANETARNIPVVIITTTEDVASMEKAFNSGANLLMIKPSKMNTYHRRLNRLLEDESLLLNTTLERFVLV